MISTQFNFQYKKGVLVLPFGVFFVMAFGMSIPGLEPSSMKALALLCSAIISWIFIPEKQLYTAITVLIALPMFKIMPFEKSVAGFSHSATWLLISTFIISAALAETGLDKRLAYYLIRLGGNKPKNILLSLLLTAVAFVFIVPSSGGRTALIMPICNGICSTLPPEGSDNFKKTIYLGATYQTLLASILTITGSLSVVFAIGLFASLYNYIWSYTHWLITFLPIVMINTLSIWLILQVFFPLPKKMSTEHSEYIEKALTLMGKASFEEKKLSYLLVLMLSLWFLSDWHGYSASLVALIVSFFIISPLIGVIGADKAVATVDLKLVIMFAASLSLADSLQHTGIIGWIESNGNILNLEAISPFIFSVLLMVFISIIRIAFVSVLSVSVAILPLILALMQSWGYNPIWAGCIGIVSFMLSFFLPTQSVTGMIAYSSNQFTMDQMFRPGVVLTIMVILTTSFFAVYYWPLIGLEIYL